MLGLIIIYFLGKKFYELADYYNKHKWGFAIVGVISYYIGSFIGAFLIGIGVGLVDQSSLDDTNDLFLGILAIPFGLFSCWATYRILEGIWKDDELEEKAELQ